ncbi:winged helix-turn-helix domain-containing protein [Streptomyces sp. NPDC056165]|uniref:winged helix-turn-helix domain-containing protein n=1 Tax=Streptomyces sp. NPDC056165 TaxID=3345733 RepID=UPI0035D546E1
MNLTHQKALRRWLLIVLAESGGGATKGEALRGIRRKYGHMLTDADKDVQPSNGETKWENRTAYERANLVREHLIRPRSEVPKGWWELTATGRAEAQRFTAAETEGQAL